MKKILRNAIAPILLAMALTHPAYAEESDLRSIIESANTIWNQALNSGNAAMVASLYTESASLSPGNGATLTGRTEIEKLFKSFVDAGVHNHKIDIIEVGGSGNLIYQVAKWNANGSSQNGKEPNFGGVLMSLLVKDSNGKWLIRSHVWNMSN